MPVEITKKRKPRIHPVTAKVDADVYAEIKRVCRAVGQSHPMFFLDAIADRLEYLNKVVADGGANNEQ